MSTVVFEIPLVGDSAHHQETLSALDRLVGEEPERLILKLLGPGGLTAEATLAYHDILGTLGRGTQVVTISYANLIGADLVLFLIGSSRDIRTNAWCYVPSSWTSGFYHLPEHHDGRGPAVIYQDGGTVSDSDLRQVSWDYRKCLELMEEHVDLESILDRRLEAEDLKQHLLIDSGELDALLIRALGRTAGAAEPIQSERRRIADDSMINAGGASR